VVPGKDQTQSGVPTNCGYDGFEIGVASSKGNLKKAFADANMAKSNQSWGIYFDIHTTPWSLWIG
jgi:mannan endo-1,4-beta-mannosidase